MMSDSAPPGQTAPAETPESRLRSPWQHVLRICVAAFLLWLVLFAPTLQHNAQVSPVGTRRTVALDVLGPIAATSRALQLSRIVSWTDEATGRTGNRPGNGALTTLGPGHHRGGHPVKPPSTGGQPSSPPTTVTSPSTGGSGGDITHPTAANPLRVLILGDSLGIDMGGPLQNDLANTGVVQATLDARESTGLTRPDYFNWPAELQTDLGVTHPQVIVIMIGANDPQDFPGPPDIPFTSPQWNVMYAARVARLHEASPERGGDRDLGRDAADAERNALRQDVRHQRRRPAAGDVAQTARSTSSVPGHCSARRRGPMPRSSRTARVR